MRLFSIMMRQVMGGLTSATLNGNISMAMDISEVRR